MSWGSKTTDLQGEVGPNTTSVPQVFLDKLGHLSPKRTTPTSGLSGLARPKCTSQNSALAWGVSPGGGPEPGAPHGPEG